MALRSFRFRPVAGFLPLAVVLVGAASAADPTAEQALKLAPVQRDVDYDRPAADQIARCTIQPEKSERGSGWAVFGPSGELLRRFVDTNSDGAVDVWCYFKDGLEVYRDIDSNFNRKADQYRWLNTAGTRWGIDETEDRTIDAWREISAEEVTQEAVAALRDADGRRFARLLLTEDELAALGLSAARTKELSDRIAAAPEAFAAAARGNPLASDARWLHFGGARPGAVPSGTDGATKDLVVYENVVTAAESAGKHEQILVGTLIQVGRVWRLIDAPRRLSGKGGELAHAGFFFRAAPPQLPDRADGAPKIDQRARQAIADLERLDKELAAAPAANQNALNARRAELLLEMADRASDASERGQWLRQLADTVSIAVQSGTYADGLATLDHLIQTLEKKPGDAELIPYFTYRRLTADYGRSLQSENADFNKLQAAWIAGLEKFLAEHGASSDAADAMLQLAIALEFSGKEEEAKNWYSKLVEQFPKAPPARKAAGAKFRLESVGKTIPLSGKTLDGRTVSLANYAGRVVLIHYWATWCEPCEADIKQIKELHAKFAPQGFAVLGVNFDSSSQAPLAQLKKDPLPWLHIHDAGGLEGRLANELGILTLPTMILVDPQGKVIRRNIHISEIEPAFKQHLRTASRPSR